MAFLCPPIARCLQQLFTHFLSPSHRSWLVNRANGLPIGFPSLFLIDAMILYHGVLVAVDRIFLHVTTNTALLQECARRRLILRPARFIGQGRQTISALHTKSTLSQGWATFNDPTSFLSPNPKAGSYLTLLFLSASIRLFSSQSFQHTHLLELSPTTLLWKIISTQFLSQPPYTYLPFNLLRLPYSFTRHTLILRRNHL